MFIKKQEKDKLGKNQVRFYVTQGDTCGIISTPKDKDGNVVDPALISIVKFKLYEDDDARTTIFEKELNLYDTNKYIFKLLSEENTFDVGRYKYEIEYTFIDGDVNTPNQWYFEVTEQANR